MIVDKINPKYIQWLSPEDMHKQSLSWISQMNFIKDEQHFFDELITAYTRKLIETRKFAKNKDIIDSLNESRRNLKKIIKKIVKHENGLVIMVDGIDQKEEESAYKNTHRELIDEVNYYLNDYRTLKRQLFGMIKDIMKTEKQKRLIAKK
jgi:hypothetical protein